MEKKIFKKKLTISISDSSKKNLGDSKFSKGKNKTTVIVEKKSPSGFSRSSGFNRSKPRQKNFQNKPNFQLKSSSIFNKNPKFANDYEKRKLAEQRATKRAKGIEDKPKKSFDKRRENKLTLSRALNHDEIGEKSRSMASIKRAKKKESKTSTQDNLESSKQIVRDVKVPKIITIRELANRMSEQASSVIKHLLGMGVTATINHSIDSDTAEYLIKEFGHNPVKEEKIDIKIEKNKLEDSKNLKKRSPIVTVMGHVDHGKTSLLDALKNTDIVSSEHGGITQHIGAYQVAVEGSEKITFIDTPGHAAFTEMRARGSKLTDLVILVVAGDDGVKTQTVEAIKHAKAANVPIIVAINKCDLPNSDPQKIKTQLMEHQLIAEEFSGDTLFVEVSAKTKKNLDKLKESILLQAELLDLKADYEKKGTGVILESKIDTGRGPISTVVVTNGVLNKGDYFISGETWGKIRALINEKGNSIDKAEPSMPIEILGMDSIGRSGDDFIVVESENKAKEISDYRKENTKSDKSTLVFATQESAFKNDKAKEMNIIIKSDVHGSSEAIKNSISNINHAEVTPKIIHSEVGLITETDISLAKATNAILIAFNVKPSKEAKKMAETFKIKIKNFNVIYEVIDFIKSSLSGLLKPDVKEKIIGSAEIQEIFKVSQVGKVAGSKVIDGEINQGCGARLIRDGKVVYIGKINSIFREKNEAKKVIAGLECGVTLKDFNDYKKKDVIEAYSITSTERTI